MSVEVILEDARWETCDLDALAKRAVSAVLAHFDLAAGWDVTVLGGDDARIAELNGAFREKPQPTNVLSWPSVDRAAVQVGAKPDLPQGGPELGDIALAYETCQREAAEQNKPFNEHILHLLVHAVLHLMGYDHVRDGDGDLMEATEIAILQKLGVPDPY